MPRPTIAREKVFTPKAWEFTQTIFRTPNCAIICGNCDWRYRSRDWIKLFEDDRPIGSLIGCPACHNYNRIPYYVD